jgi:hypothetical protein
VSETRTLHAAGLWTNPNELSGRPDGALSVAENIEIPAVGKIKPTRGMTLLGYEYPMLSVLSSGVAYEGFNFEHVRAATWSAGAGNKLIKDTGVAKEEVEMNGASATVAPPTGARVRFTTANGDLYLTSSTGPLVLDGASAELEIPGAPKAQDFDYTILYGGLFGGNTGGTGFLAAGYATAYRAVIGFNDEEGRVVLGSPSGRAFVYNPTFTATLTRTAGGAVTLNLDGVPSIGLQTGDIISVSPVDANNPGSTTKTVGSMAADMITYNEAGTTVTDVGPYTVTLLTRPTLNGLVLPPGLEAGRHFIQLYRAVQVPIGQTPGDDMRLVVERPLTAGEISASYAYIVDLTPDISRGPPLYTNNLQQGITQANERPPLVHDVTVFRQALMGVNVTRHHRLPIQFIGLPAAGDVLTLNGLAYTANVGGSNDASGNWSVETGAEYTLSQQIERTARLFVRAVNVRTGNSSIRAYYVSGADDPPGMVVIEALTVGVSAFTIEASAHGDRFVPDISDPVSSVAERIPNGVAISKPGLPYAFPPASQNLLRVGAEEKENLRGIALKDSFWVLKGEGGDGGGIWKITGSGPGAFYVEQVSSSVYLIAPETAVVLNNTIYALTNKGVVAISEGGIDVVSVPIEDKIKALLEQPAMVPVIFEHAVAVAYEAGTDAKYMLHLPMEPDDDHATYGLVFNTNPEIQGWVERTGYFGEAAGLYMGTNKLLTIGLYVPTTAYENRTGTLEDYKLFGDTIPIRFGWTVDSANYPGAPKDFQEQTLFFGEAHTFPLTITWTSDLGETAELQAYPEGRKYVHQLVHEGVAWSTRLETVWSYTIWGEDLTVLGLTTQMLIYPEASSEM